MWQGTFFGPNMGTDADGDPISVAPSGVAGHPELRRDDIEPLGAVFADTNHLAAAARPLDALGFDHPLDARQVAGSRPMLRSAAGRFGRAGRVVLAGVSSSAPASAPSSSSRANWS